MKFEGAKRPSDTDWLGFSYNWTLLLLLLICTFEAKKKMLTDIKLCCIC